MTTITVEGWQVGIAAGVTALLAIGVVVMCYITRRRTPRVVGAQGEHLPYADHQVSKKKATQDTHNPLLGTQGSPHGPGPQALQAQPQIDAVDYKPLEYHSPPMPPQNNALNHSTARSQSNRDSWTAGINAMEELNRWIGDDKPNSLANSSNGDATPALCTPLSQPANQPTTELLTPNAQPRMASEPDLCTYNYNVVTEDDRNLGRMGDRFDKGGVVASLLLAQRKGQRLGLDSPTGAEFKNFVITKNEITQPVGLSFEAKRPVVGAVEDGSLAEAAGLTTGMRLVAVNGEKVYTAGEAVSEVNRAEYEVNIVVAAEKAGRNPALNITPPPHVLGASLGATTPDYVPKQWMNHSNVYAPKGRGIGNFDFSSAGSPTAQGRRIRRATSMQQDGSPNYNNPRFSTTAPARRITPFGNTPNPSRTRKSSTSSSPPLAHGYA